MTTATIAARARRIAEEDQEARVRPCPACQQPKSGGRDLLCQGCWRRLPLVLVKLYHYVWKLKQADLIPDEAFAELERLVVLDASGTQPRRAPLASAVAAAVLAGSPRGAPLEAGTKVEILPEQRVTPPRAPAKEGGSAHHQLILSLLPPRSDHALRTDQIARRAKLSPATVKSVLRQLAFKRLARCQARATGKGRPPNYWWAA